LGNNSTSFTNQGLINANVAGRTLTIDPGNVPNAFLNEGTLRASNGGTLVLSGNGLGDFSNSGTFEALDGSALTMDASAVLTNNVGGVLTGGTYRAVASSSTATLTITGNSITQIASGTTVELNGAGSIFEVLLVPIETTLTSNAGTLKVLGNRNYSNINALSNDGTIQLGGGIFNALSLTNNATGTFVGFGNVTPRPTNHGLIESNGGTLTFADGINGGSGTVQIDAGSVLDLSGGTSGSSADFLIHNGSTAGSLNLGANNFTVAMDYTNANFGIGNNFNPRANVAGTGLILASGDVGLSITGDVTAGTMAFNNVHVGSTTTLNYKVNNTGTSGPSLRGAIQTSVNGGNINDSRLGGAGATAGNFGPIALGSNTGNLAVTFNATSAGSLSGQIVHLISNFDNVAGQNVNITGAAYRFASPTAHTPEPVSFGNFHVGDTAPSQFLSIKNNVPNDGFSEKLDGSIGSATGGVTTNGGSFSLLDPGATDSTSLEVGINTSSAGDKSGTATIALTSDGMGTSGLANTTLTSQTVNVTGAVYRFASPSAHTPEPVTLANVHVGASDQMAISITNTATNDGFSEKLDASFTGTTGSATATGSFSLLAAGSTDNSSLIVGLDTSSAGAKTGTATIDLTSDGSDTSHLANTALTSQTVNISGNVYRLASPTTHTPEPVNFGIVHVGDTAPSQSLSITNNVSNDGFSEKLNATIGGVTGGVTASGSFSQLAAGSTSTALSVGINTTTAGNKSGTATIGFASDGTGTSGLGVTALPAAAQNVTVNGQVNFFADPVITFKSGSATLIKTDPTHYTLDFGTLQRFQGTVSVSFGVQNFLNDATFQDTLGGTFNTAGVTHYSLTGFPTNNTFSGIAPGSSLDPTISFDPNRLNGPYAESIFLTVTSANSSTTSNLPTIEIDIYAQVIPEPSTWLLVLGGFGGLIALQRARRLNRHRR
jgi:hypothetical protein